MGLIRITHSYRATAMRLAQICTWIVLCTTFCTSAQSQILPPNFRPIGSERTVALRSQVQGFDARISGLDTDLTRLRQALATINNPEELNRLAGEIEAEASRLENDAADNSQRAGVANQESVAAQAVATSREEALRARQAEYSGVQQRHNQECRVEEGLQLSAEASAGCENLRGQLAQIAVRIIEDSTAAARARETAQRMRSVSDSLSNAAAGLRRLATERREDAETIRKSPSLASARSDLINQIDVRQRERDRLSETRTAVNDSLSQRVKVTGRWIVPIRSRSDAVVFYGAGGKGFLQNVTLANSLEGAEARTITTEMYSDYVGPFRFAGHVVVASTEAEGDGDQPNQQEDPNDPAALQRFFAGGGTLVASGGIPLLYVPFGSAGGMVFQHLTKAGIDLFEPGETRYFDQTTANLDMGFETYGSLMPIKDFGGFAFVRWGGVAGTSLFYQGLGYGGRKPFGYLQWNFGLRLGPALQVVLSNTDGPYHLNRRTTVQFQVSPPDGT